MTIYINDFSSRFRKGLVNPFESTWLTEWCRHCRMEVSAEADQGQFKKIFVFRKRCLRCGRVIQYGVYRSAMASKNPKIQKMVKEWISEAGKDRS